MSNTEFEEDFLEVDSNIPGQNYVCLSFVSPEKTLKQKEIFMVTKFLHQVFNDKERKYQDLRDKMSDSVNITYDSVNEMYKDWRISRNKELEQDFYEMNDFRTTVRGLKVRGTYDTLKEANKKATILRRKDPAFNVFVGQVGYWLPWDPECQDIENQEYQEGELNNLMKKYKENVENKDVLYEKMKEERIKNAREEVRRKKELAKKEALKIDSKEEAATKIDGLRTILNEVDENLYETEQKKFQVTKQQEEQLKIEELKKEDVVNNFKSDNMSKLEEVDPWLKRKMESSNSNNSETTETSQTEETEEKAELNNMNA